MERVARYVNSRRTTSCCVTRSISYSFRDRALGIGLSECAPPFATAPIYPSAASHRTGSYCRGGTTWRESSQLLPHSLRCEIAQRPAGVGKTSRVQHLDPGRVIAIEGRYIPWTLHGCRIRGRVEPQAQMISMNRRENGRTSWSP